MDEAFVEGLDKTHFIINVDNGKTLGFRGDKNVKYADVTLGSVGMNMVIRIRGGKFARLVPAFMIFQKESRNYPICAILEDVPGVTYRTGPKGWMYNHVMVQYLKERRVVYPYSGVLFMNNCGDHNDSPEQ